MDKADFLILKGVKRVESFVFQLHEPHIKITDPTIQIKLKQDLMPLPTDLQMQRQ